MHYGHGLIFSLLVESVTLDEMIGDSLDEGIETTSFNLKGNDQVG